MGSQARHARLSDRTLLAVKAAVLVAIPAAVFAWRTVGPSWPEVCDDRLGLELTYPPDWHARKWSGFALEARETSPNGGTSTRRCCCVCLERYRWYEFELMRGYLTHHALDPRWRDGEAYALREVLPHLGMQADSSRPARLNGLRAVMVTGPRVDGWGAAVIARQDAGFVVLHLYAPTERDLRRVWPRFERMVRSARIYPPAPSPQPDWGPPDHL